MHFVGSYLKMKIHILIFCSLVSAYGGGERCAQTSGGEPEGRRPLGRPRRKWEDNIKMDLCEVGGVCEEWMELAQDRERWRALVSTVMNFRIP